MPPRGLPGNANLEQLKNGAKSFQRAVRAGDAGAAEVVREFHPRLGHAQPGSPELATFKLADAQLVVARSFGFPSRARIKPYIELTKRYSRSPADQPIGEPIANARDLVDEFLRLACLNYGQDDSGRWEHASYSRRTPSSPARRSIRSPRSVTRRRRVTCSPERPVATLPRGGRLPGPNRSGPTSRDALLPRVEHRPRPADMTSLPERFLRVATAWRLELGEPYVRSGQVAWVAPATNAAGDELALKVGWRHWEAEHEADALRLWDGDGAVRCLKAETFEHATALLLERCVPGTPLRDAMPEREQDVVVAGLLRRLWDHELPTAHPFRALAHMCNEWASELEHRAPIADRSFDGGLTRAAIELLRELPSTATANVLLATDLHAGNILAAEREPWLAIDPKPFVGDPAYDPIQHMLNCGERLATDPGGLARRIAELLDLDRARTALWLFARCAQESADDPSMREPARRLAP